MKSISLLVLISIGAYATDARAAPNAPAFLGTDSREWYDAREFLSWYDGWGTHTIWGGGEVSGSYKQAFVLCGDTVVPVRAIHDTHESDGRPLAPEQTAEFAQVSNGALLQALAAQGDECVFEPASTWRPN